MSRSLQSVAVNLEPGQFLSGWRSETESLFLPVLSDSRVGDEAAVRIGIFGQTIRATVFGKVSLVRRMGRPSLPPGVELSLDRASVPAARFLAMAARGEPVTFRERAPRYVHERALAVTAGAAVLQATTLNVSEGGCSLVWPDDLPQGGDVVTLKLSDGFFAPTIRAVICWNTLGGAVERSVGLRIVAEGRGGRAWREFVESVARSGARSA
jgi:PilZ domain-containing protein